MRLLSIFGLVFNIVIAWLRSPQGRTSPRRPPWSLRKLGGQWPAAKPKPILRKRNQLCVPETPGADIDFQFRRPGKLLARCYLRGGFGGSLFLDGSKSHPKGPGSGVSSQNKQTTHRSLRHVGREASLETNAAESRTNAGSRRVVVVAGNRCIRWSGGGYDNAEYWNEPPSHSHRGGNL